MTRHPVDVCFTLRQHAPIEYHQRLPPLKITMVRFLASMKRSYCSWWLCSNQYFFPHHIIIDELVPLPESTEKKKVDSSYTSSMRQKTAASTPETLTSSTIFTPPLTIRADPNHINRDNILESQEGYQDMSVDKDLRKRKLNFQTDRPSMRLQSGMVASNYVTRSLYITFSFPAFNY